MYNRAMALRFDDAEIKTPDATTPVATTFTQEQVNAIMKKEKEIYQKKQSEIMGQLNILKDSKNLTDKEKSDLENQINDLRKQTMTTEELSKEQISKLEKSHKSSMDKLSEEKDIWKQRFTDSTIEKAIIDAAIENNAFYPEQIVALLTPKTQLVEELDAEGKTTGNLIPKVNYETIDEKGKIIELVLHPKEAVKKMTEENKYANLFKSDRTSGFGVNTLGSSMKSKIDLKDTAAYIKRRNEKKGIK